MDRPGDDLRVDAYQSWRRGLRHGIRRRGLDPTVPELVLLLPDLVHVVGRLVSDPRVPGRPKLQLLLVLAYLVSPIDLIPEMLVGPIGYVDDVALLLLALERLLRTDDGELARLHWAGGRGTFRLVWTGLSGLTRLLGLLRGRGSSADSRR